MKNFWSFLNFILLLILCVILLFNYQEKKKLSRELHDLNSTLDYVDRRMDTLEFYREAGDARYVK